ncbi:MAG: transcription elongation factor SPT4 [Planctomycetota bacterium]
MNTDGVFLRDELKNNFSDLVIENLWTTPVTLPFFVLPIAVYVLLTRAYGPQKVLEQETRCRKCQYILRGITEPRCPECGEKI